MFSLVSAIHSKTVPLQEPPSVMSSSAVVGDETQQAHPHSGSAADTLLGLWACELLHQVPRRFLFVRHERILARHSHPDPVPKAGRQRIRSVPGTDRFPFLPSHQKRMPAVIPEQEASVLPGARNPILGQSNHEHWRRKSSRPDTGHPIRRQVTPTGRDVSSTLTV